MALKRSQITLSDTELQEFLDEERIVTCATIGPNGRPHLMPLWYVVENGLVAAWTFGKSQKVRNLERVPQATLQIEAGRDRYAELRGAMLECDVEILRDPASVEAIGLGLARRYGGLAPDAEVRRGARQRAEAGAQARGPALHSHADGELGSPKARRGLLTAPAALERSHAPVPGNVRAPGYRRPISFISQSMIAGLDRSASVGRLGRRDRGPLTRWWVL